MRSAAAVVGLIYSPLLVLIGGLVLLFRTQKRWRAHAATAGMLLMTPVAYLLLTWAPDDELNAGNTFALGMGLLFLLFLLGFAALLYTAVACLTSPRRTASKETPAC